MLSHANLTRLARLHLEHDFSRDLVQEYLDSLLGVEAFEPLEASKDEGITDSVTAKTPKSRSRQSKKAKSQTAPPSEKSRPSEQSKPSSTRRRQGPKPPRQLKHDAPGGHTVGVGLKETDPTSETTNSRKLTLPPAAQCGEDVAKRVAKMVPESRAKQITEQSGAVEHKAQELALGDTEPTQIRNKGRNGRRMKQRSRSKQKTQGQGQGQGVMTEQLEDEPRSSRNFEVHAQTDKTGVSLLSPRKNEELVIDQSFQPASTVARTGNRNSHRRSNGRKRHGESSRGGKGRNCSLEAGNVSMRQIVNEVGRVQTFELEVVKR